MEQYILTHPEADIISTLRNEDEASIYEITTATRLTPSQALETLNQLSQRDLVQLVENDRVARLTAKGRHVRMLLDRQEKQPFSGGSGATPIVIISNEESSRAAQFEELEPQELETALDSELQKLAES
jgi:DNA-binding MarR family transcriptional regulator